jgi:two-component system OmpR family response regulator
LRLLKKEVYTIALRGASILVVEDEKDSREIIGRYLAAMGHRVTGAGSAEEAARLLKERAFDFVLLDVVLPGRTGLQALAEFRGLTKAPLNIMSGYNDDEARRDALLLGANGFFGKPLDLPAIAAAVAALPDRPA